MQRIFGKRIVYRIDKRYQSKAAASHVLDTASLLNQNSDSLLSSVPKASWAETVSNRSPRDFIKEKRPLQGVQLDKLGLDSLEYQLDDSRLSKLSQQDINKWLSTYEIPAYAYQENEDQDESEIKELYARQLRLECSVHDIAMERYSANREHILGLGRGSNLKSSKTLMDDWFTPLKDAITQEQEKYLGLEIADEMNNNEDKTDRNLYGPALLLLQPKSLAVLAIGESLNMSLMDRNGSSFVKVAAQLGRMVQQELKHMQQHGDKGKLWLRIAKMVPDKKSQVRCKKHFETVGNWDKRMTLKLGALLVELILENCVVPNPLATPDDPSIPSYVPAFEHKYHQLDMRRRVGMFRCSNILYSFIVDGKGGSKFLPWTARFLPMLVKPRPWTDTKQGGYLRLESAVMRTRDGDLQHQFLAQGDLKPLYQALNYLGDVPWQINVPVYEVIKKLWAAGGGFGDLPSRQDLPIPNPENFDMSDEAEEKAYHRLVKKVSLYV